MRLFSWLMATTLIFTACVACGKGQSNTSPAPTPAGLTQGSIRAQLDSPEFKKHVQEKLALMQKEEQVVEKADWFGKTGLPDSVERELPRYLRRELGQSIFEKGALKADDLHYVGVFPEGLNSTHFWRVDDGAKDEHFAYVTASAGGDTFTGWGGKRPPAAK